MESINIKTTIKSSQDGDPEAFRSLYEATIDRVYPFVLCRVSDKADAKDVTQDSYVELHASLSRFSYQSDAAFYAFLFTIVRRRLAKHYNSVKRHDADVFDESHHGAVATETETQVAITQALSQLDEQSREIVVLHHWSRFTFSEIGTLINMTESAVRVRHHRARAKLASLLNT